LRQADWLFPEIISQGITKKISKDCGKFCNDIKSVEKYVGCMMRDSKNDTTPMRGGEQKHGPKGGNFMKFKSWVILAYSIPLYFCFTIHI
jgi:hypothetical protein